MLAYFQSATADARLAGVAALEGKARGLIRYAPFLGPAIIASVAYMDPGNFATNIQSGAQFGYLLLWVVLLANLIAMLFQALSARLGIVTGKSLAEACRDRFSKPVVYGMWILSELAAIATDLAEVVGGAIALALLFHMPLLSGCAVMGLTTYLVMLLNGYGFRPMEIIISAFVSVISLSYLIELFIAPPQWGSALVHTFIPSLQGGSSLLLAVGIMGATVMPHAIYLHSSLTKDRIATQSAKEKRQLIRYSNREVLFALSIAGLVNMAMLAMSATVFHFSGATQIADIGTAYRTLAPLLGAGAAGIFLVSLFASGFSSSVVGTMAGQTIMQDFVHFQIPLWLRRALTLVPPFIVVALGVNAMQALIISQVVLSFTLPVPLIALIYLTSRPKVMGNFSNSRPLTALTVLAAAVIVLLNLLLLLQFVHIPMP